MVSAVYLWRWLIDFKWRNANSFYNINRNIKEYHTLYLLLNHYKTLGVFYEEEMVKSLKELIKKSDTFSNPPFIRYLAYSMLGKIEFEKGLFPVALTHFREALNNFYQLDYQDPEEEARLYAWIGLSSFKLGKYKEAEEYFTKAINVLEGFSDKKPVIGEIRVLLADALYFTNPSEAIQEAELAHEILKTYLSPFFVVNAIKLSAGLIARNYTEEGYSVLSEAVNRYPEITKLLNINFVKTLKFVENNAKKVIIYKEPETLNSLKDAFLGYEGLKGMYYVFRKVVKPEIEPNRLLMFNSKIVSSLKKPDKAEELIQLKNNFIEKSESIGLQTLGDYPIYKISEKIKQLINLFGEVGILSFYDAVNPNEFRVSFYWSDGNYESIITRMMNIDEEALDLVNLKSEQASEKLTNYLPNDVLDKIQSIKKDGLIIVSPSLQLFALPWDLLPTNDPDFPYLGLKNYLTIVPTIQEIRFWEKEVKPYNKKLYYSQFEGLPRGLGKEISNHLKDLGYWKHKNFSKDLASELSANVEIFLYIGNTIESLDGDIFIKVGREYYSILDIEKIKMRGNVAILGTPCGSETIIDEFGAHNLMISMILSGFRSAVGCLSPPRDLNRFVHFLVLLLKGDGFYLYERVRNAKLKMYLSGERWWVYQLYGNPIVVI